MEEVVKLPILYISYKSKYNGWILARETMYATFFMNTVSVLNSSKNRDSCV